jgi:hypothetical protein
MSSPTHIPVIGYNRERICSDGAMLNGLLDRPNGVAQSYTDLARASLPHLARYREDPHKALLGSMLRLPAEWVGRRRIGRRVECTLAERGRSIVNCELSARIIGWGPYVGLRRRPNLAEAATRRGAFGTDLKPLRFPDHIQDLVDECIGALGVESYVDRHAALDQLTSWLEMGDRSHATLADERTWRRSITPTRLGALALRRCATEEPTLPSEVIAQLRAELVGVLAGDPALVDPNAATYVVFPVRSRSGQYAVLGALFAAGGLSNPTPLTWEGLFRRSADFLTWLADTKGLLPSLWHLTSLAYVEQIAMWPR